MKKSLHIALLVCDVPIPEVLEKSGNYREMFPKVFGLAAQNLQIQLTWEFFDVVEEQNYPSPLDIQQKKYDAIMITGSKHNAHDFDAWIVKLVEFVKTTQQAYHDLKWVGICFGHQIIARALGGISNRNNKGWEKINQSHQDHVMQLPKGFKALAYTDNTPHQIMISQEHRCISVQGHPEFSKETSRIMLERKSAQGVYPKDLAKRALEKLEAPELCMDDVWLSAKFLEFVLLN
ncbi:class I glutamine amidotransferase-like protein [Sporodiniella umbellata]|nr:class I glutamine amidotransferase-like protein [Sporodiniella umbellata]